MEGEKIVEVWENQRHVAFKGWGPHRLPVDRPSWSNKKGDIILHTESFLLPLGYKWQNAWTVADYGEDGWYYAPDYSIPTRFASPKSSPLSLVRRRQWVRTMVPYEWTKEELSRLGHQHWSSVSNYGFPISSEEEVAQEQKRQHLGFAALYPYLIETAKQKIPSPSRGSSSPSGGMSPASPSPRAAGDDDVGEGEEDDEGPSSPYQAVEDEEWVPRLKSKPAVSHCVYKHGVPHVMRQVLWPRWCGALQLKSRNPDYFSTLSNEASLITEGETYQEIQQDVVRTAPKHPYFEGRGSTGALRLTNTLLALSLHPQAPPYHQAFSYIMAALLLNLSPEDSFWVMICLLDRMLPQGYHEHYLLQYDIRIVTELLRECFPELEASMERNQIDVGVFASGWLQGVFCAHFPFPSACRILDIMFFEGNSSILVRMVIAFLKLHQKEIMACDGSGSVGQYANNFARNASSIDEVLKSAMNDGLSAKVLARRGELMKLSEAMMGEYN